MWRILIFLLFVPLTVPALTSKPSCEPPSKLIVDDYIIEGSASQEGTPPPVAFVSLYYYRGKLVRRVPADAQGQFTLDNLPRGDYRLFIDGLGSFTVKVRPEAGGQRGHYLFYVHHGCRGWTFNND